MYDSHNMTKNQYIKSENRLTFEMGSDRSKGENWLAVGGILTSGILA